MTCGGTLKRLNYVTSIFVHSLFHLWQRQLNFLLYGLTDPNFRQIKIKLVSHLNICFFLLFIFFLSFSIRLQ